MYFDSVQPKSECIFPFLYNLIFQLNTGYNHILSPVAIKNGVCPHSGCSSTLGSIDCDVIISKNGQIWYETYVNLIK